MNHNNIGWDAHLDRLWNEHTDAQDAYSVAQRVEEIEEELRDLDDEQYNASAEGDVARVLSLQIEIDELESELDSIRHG